MKLIEFIDPVECKCIKRPSVVIKSPYVADILINNKEMLAHCPSLGLGNIIQPDSIMLATKSNTKTKTDYTIQAVLEDNVWVGNVPLHANRIVKNLLENTNHIMENIKHIKPEFKYGDSRFDFLINLNNDECIYCEVKSVHIKQNNTAIFPVGYIKPKQNTVSERANKHLTELISLAKENKKAMLIFVVQRGDCDKFSPNLQKDPIFSGLLHSALQNNVIIKIIYTYVDTKGIYFRYIEDYK
uniref:Sugar fermentation stimulation protein C-terminal domain-containing protein n=1 Tax=viral metagenome TaxID=1070528 RepID=A0A6C0F5J1_9ZZZZ|tara:strand:- start:17582 stop:18307 length:726 start_codon:yes stop_codon:yes gene_type:complete